ncbi:hypothetical protein DB44_BP00140 [Candidatus Protochlamydia amoebophila]|uniref:Uncharacterized protein n=2 Tax=Candidatus Protochlamydia amoebophila TaxID=362787 RepID=A0A0C1HEC0_9BACT|nr:hypothetical protein DB44_BP00140 [Candidatus Protochlamydia amoebophila]
MGMIACFELAVLKGFITEFITELKKIMKQLVDQGKAERVKQTNIEHALNELMLFDYPNFKFIDES